MAYVGKIIAEASQYTAATIQRYSGTPGAVSSLSFATLGFTPVNTQSTVVYANGSIIAHGTYTVSESTSSLNFDSAFGASDTVEIVSTQNQGLPIVPTTQSVTAAMLSVDLNADINQKVDASQVLTDVPSGAVFTDTTYTAGIGINLDSTSFSLTDESYTNAEKNKLAGIEAGADVNLTAFEIKTAYESNSQTNAFTDTLLSKLNAIESSATQDQTAAEIKTAYESNTNTNEFSDAEQTKLSGIESNATQDQTGSEIKSLLTTVGTQLNDNVVASFGTSNDLKIWHDGLNSYIKDHDAGNLFIQGSTTVTIEDVSGNNMAVFNDGGSVDLYHGAISRVSTTSSGISVTGNISASGTVDGRDVATDGSKLDGIESNATQDQTATEIKTAYESNTNTNAYTDAEQSKLSLIEASATADQTATEIKTAYESNTNTNAYTDAEVTKLLGIETGAEVNTTSEPISYVTGLQSALNLKASIAYVDAEVSALLDAAPLALNTLNELAAALGDDASFSTTVTNSIATKLPLAGGTISSNLAISGTLGVTGGSTFSTGNFSGAVSTGAITTTGNISVSGTVDGRDVATDGSKLDGIETGATADQTAAEIKTAYESNVDTNEFSNAEQTKLSGIESGSTADQTAAEIKTAYESNANSNEFSDAEQTKLAGIETSATADQTGSEIKSLLSTVGTQLNDNVKANFGNSNDLQIYHDGLNSYIKEEGVGDLYIKGTNIHIQHVDSAPDEYMAQFVANGTAKLYYDGSKKIETTSTGIDVTGNISASGTVDGRDVATDGSKLDGIESGATADQTAAEIKTAYESNANSNEFSDAEQTKLSGIETSATADQTAAEILTLIKTVDGSGSGLDADLLDGQSSAYYATASSTAAKLPLSGGTLTGNVRYNDNVKANFGASDDLQIYHDGSNSYIRDIGEGNLNLRGTNVGIVSESGYDMFWASDTHGVSLYYQNSPRLETSLNGIDITGTITADGLDMEDNQKILLGASDDLQIFHDGSNSYIIDNGTGDLIIRGENTYLQSTTGEQYITCSNNGGVSLSYNNSSKFTTNSVGIEVNGRVETDTLMIGAYQPRSGTTVRIGGISEFEGAVANTKASGSVSGTTNIDMSAYSYYAHTLTGNTTYTVSNIPVGFTSFILELTNGGAYTITWPSYTKWNAGVSPTLTSSGGVDMIQFMTDDGGTTWRGVLVMLDNR
jgi:hypothetical protein